LHAAFISAAIFIGRCYYAPYREKSTYAIISCRIKCQPCHAMPPLNNIFLSHFFLHSQAIRRFSAARLYFSAFATLAYFSISFSRHLDRGFGHAFSHYFIGRLAIAITVFAIDTIFYFSRLSFFLSLLPSRRHVAAIAAIDSRFLPSSSFSIAAFHSLISYFSVFLLFRFHFLRQPYKMPLSLMPYIDFISAAIAFITLPHYADCHFFDYASFITISSFHFSRHAIAMLSIALICHY